MKRNLAYVMLLLFITITTNAKAEDRNINLAEQERHKRKAEKIIGLLNAAGLTHPLVEQTAVYIQQNSHDDYFYFSEKQYDKFSLGLRHELGTPKLERLELFLQPDDANYIYTLSPEAVLIRYRVEF